MSVRLVLSVFGGSDRVLRVSADLHLRCFLGSRMLKNSFYRQLLITLKPQTKLTENVCQFHEHLRSVKARLSTELHSFLPIIIVSTRFL